ncbi:MAG: C40 family peptidase [Nitrospirota bacterium]
MLKRTLLILFAAGALQSAAAAEPPANGSLGIISVPLANVREEPVPKSPIATQVLLGDEVRILEKQEYRYRIAIPVQGDREGWIQQEAVQVPRDKGRSYLKAERPWIVITAPKTFALILDKLGNQNVSLYAGTRLPVQERTAEGYKVQFPDRTVALISAADAAPLVPRNPVLGDVSPAEIARTARKFQGARYFAGGITAQGMDTRGLIHTVYRVHGIDLDPSSNALPAGAVKVSKKDLLPGDILVFNGEGLGLYLSNGQFLHSVRKNTVQLGGIHDRRFANSFLYGLRVTASDPDQKKRPAEMTADEIMVSQGLAASLPLGRRIVYWAARFIGTPYDTDPLGLYVRTNRIIADEKADCMYLTFRAVELARSRTPGEAVDQALALRFITQGRLVDGLVQNYGERFEYGEDMVFSGTWGKNITAGLGTTTTIAGSRGRDEVIIMPKTALASRKVQKQLQDGDIIYWVKDPKKRVVGEIVAHLSFVRVKDGTAYLIHAGGTKDSASKPGGGMVKEVLMADYLRDTRFIGAFVTRFDQ